jgi:prepilin-type N-terminal cleavage/methylation domain-containing protein
MSMERGAWSGELAACIIRHTACGRCRTANSHFLTRGFLGFTLVELLVVIAIIAIMSALLAPSFQGLFSVAGRRGGANAIAGAAELARLESIRHSVPSFVGFANLTNEEAFSSVIVYRALRPDEAATNSSSVVAVSRWLRFPRGVFVDPESLGSGGIGAQSVPKGQIPLLGTLPVASLRSIKFDRFGKLATNASPVLKVGEGVLEGSRLRFIPTDQNYYEVSIQPLTGKAVVNDPLQ